MTERKSRKRKRWKKWKNETKNRIKRKESVKQKTKDFCTGNTLNTHVCKFINFVIAPDSIVMPSALLKLIKRLNIKSTVLLLYMYTSGVRIPYDVKNK